MTRAKEIMKEADKAASANTQIIGDWGEHYLGFIHGAEWADSHPHWISVEDELPPKKSEYDDLSNNVLATDGKEIYESVYNHDFEDWFTHDMWGLDKITHWMPLPQPPESGNNSKEGGEA